MQKSNLSALALISMASIVSLSACQDEDFGYTSEEIAYRTNFEKKFKDYKNVETWDFSTYNLNKLGLEGGPSFNGQTRAAGNSTTPITGRWFNVPEGVADWLDSNLKENNDNRKKGTLDFVLRMPDDHDILIIPIYQGQAGLVWNLGIKDEATGSTEIIWEKSHGIQTIRGDMNYTIETVGSATDYSPQSSDFIEKNEAGGKDSHKCLLLGSAIPSDFNPSSDWLKVTITDMGITNGESSGVFCVTDSKNNNVQSDQTWVQVNNNKGSISFDIKNEDMLRAIAQNNTDFRFAMYWSEPEFTSSNNSEIKVSIQRYKKVKGEETWQDMKDNDGNYLTDYNSGHTINQKIRSQALLVDHTKFSGYFSLYLDLQNLDDSYNGSNTFREHYASREIQSSTQSMMVALTGINTSDDFSKAVLDELKSSFWSETQNIMFLGCEDSDIPKSDGVPGSDWDMNDVVFLIVGMSKDNVRPNYEEMIRKRYMIEDLGGTFDFDFNDIVIDLEQVTDLQTGVKTQKMSLKHLCGTIPWQVQIGEGSNKFVSAQLPGRNNDCETGGDGYDPNMDLQTYGGVINVTLPNNPWNPDENNIIFTSWPSSAGWNNSGNEHDTYLAEANGRTYTFVEGGEIPYIIACDPSIEWKKEGITIPNDWYSVWKREIAKEANKLAIQQSIAYVVRGDDASEEHQRTIEYSTNSPAQVMITSETTGSGTAPTCVHDQANQTFTFDGTNASAGDYTFVISQASTTYFESKSVSIKVRVLNHALQVNDLAVTPDVITIEAGQSGVISYTTSGTGAISVDPADNVTTSINTSTKQITINVADNTSNNTMITLHIRQAEDETYYEADKAVTVKVRGAVTTLDEGNVSLYSSHTFDSGWTDFNIDKSTLNLHENDELIFKVSDFESDAKIKLYKSEWGGERDVTSNGINGDFAVTITKEMYDDYKGGLKIQGHNITLSSITKNCSHVHGYSISATHIDEGTALVNNGDHIIDYWDGYTIDKNTFNNVNVGDVIIVHVKDIYDNSQATFRNGVNWEVLPGCSEYTSITGDFELTVTSDIKSILDAQGLVLSGKHYTITKVTLRAADVVTYSLNTSVEGNGSITVTPQKSAYTAGENVTLTAVPADISSKFNSWNDGNTNATRTVQMNSDQSFTANFADNDKYTITVGDGLTITSNESVTQPGNNQYYKGSSLTITTNVPEGKIAKWKKDGNAITVTGNSLSITADANASYTVEFEDKPAVQEPEDILNNGPVTLNNSLQNLTIKENKLVEGKTLTIYYTGNYLNVYCSNGYDGMSNSPSEGSVGETKYKSFVLTKNDVDNLQNNGLFVQGDGKATSVTIN